MLDFHLQSSRSSIFFDETLPKASALILTDFDFRLIRTDFDLLGQGSVESIFDQSFATKVAAIKSTIARYVLHLGF